MKHLAIFIISLIFLSSCSDLESGYVETNPKPVVEAYLVPSQQVRIKIHQEVPYSADSSQSTNLEVPISGLKITISGENQSEVLKEEANGYYAASEKFLIKVGGAYTMKFIYKGNEISANTIIPSKPLGFTSSTTLITRAAVDLSKGFQGMRPPGGFGQNQTNINLEWQNPTNDYFIAVVENIESNPIEIIKFPSTDNRPRPNFRFRNEPVQGTQSVVGSQSFQYFGRHRIVLCKLNPDYVALYQRSGNTTQNISTPPTTIKNGLGIFTGVNADTLYVKVIEE